MTSRRRLAASILLAATTLASQAFAESRAAQETPTNDARRGASNESSSETGNENVEAALSYLAHPVSKELSAGAQRALVEYGPWARERGYVGYLSPDQSVVYFALARRSAGSERGWIEAVEESLHTLLPDPRSRHRGPLTATGGPTKKLYPLGGEVKVWKHDLEPVDTHCGVLFELDRDEHLAELSKLAGNPTRHLGEPGRSFMARDVGAWVWRVGAVPDAHQVVQGAAQHVIERRFPHLPSWLRDGIAWQVEYDVLGSVRCLLESRGETSHDFVEEWSASERLRPFAGDIAARVERLTQFAAGDDYVATAALAYETAGLLLARGGPALADVAEQLREYWEDFSVRHDARHGWQRNHSYRVPAEAQQRILAPALAPADLSAAAPAGDRRSSGKSRGT